MRSIDFAVKCIRGALTRIQDDRFTPAALSNEIPKYLVDLTRKYPDDGSEFSKFVIFLGHDALEHELLRQIVPENFRQAILDARREHEELQIKKETEIEEQNFENARNYRDRQRELVNSIRELLAGQELVVTPTLIDSALKTLGYAHY